MTIVRVLLWAVLLLLVGLTVMVVGVLMVPVLILALLLKGAFSLGKARGRRVVIQMHTERGPAGTPSAQNLSGGKVIDGSVITGPSA